MLGGSEMKKKLFIAFLILLFILTGCNSQKEKDYETDLISVVNEMLSQAAEAEKMINIYIKVWNDSIEMTLDKERLARSMGITIADVDNYIGEPADNVFKYYAFEGDFDSAIKCVSKYYENTGKNDELASNRNKIAEKIKELNDPPEKYKKSFDIAFELYSLYEKYTDMAISPSGSLVSYSQQGRELSSEIISKYKQFEVMLPNKKE
jgi:hypothetical protein